MADPVNSHGHRPPPRPPAGSGSVDPPPPPPPAINPRADPAGAAAVSSAIDPMILDQSPTTAADSTAITPASNHSSRPAPRPALPKKPRGRPPGRPNNSVNEELYRDNLLVQQWNAARLGPVKVVPIDIRAALTENMLQFNSQRNLFHAKCSHQFIHYVDGFITPSKIANKRVSYVNGLLIHSRGHDAPDLCSACARRKAANTLGPFLECRIVEGHMHNSCSNCKWYDTASECSLYTGTRPNRKRKAVGKRDGAEDVGPLEQLSPGGRAGADESGLSDGTHLIDQQQQQQHHLHQPQQQQQQQQPGNPSTGLVISYENHM